MDRSASKMYLATFIVVLGLLSVIVLHALRGRSHDRVIPRNPSRQSTEMGQVVVNTSMPSAIRSFEFRGEIEPIAPPAPNAPLAIAPAVIPLRAPDVQAIAPWSNVTVTTSIARTLPGDGRKDLQDCFALWNRETHMTKDEWRAACRRMPAHP
jgi:hypothetical protein